MIQNLRKGKTKMRNLRFVILAIFLMITVAVAAGCSANKAVGGQPVKPTYPTTPSAEVLELISTGSYYDKYVGPETCMDCHEEKHAKWETSRHVKKAMEGPAVIGTKDNIWEWVPERWDEFDTYVILDQKDKNTLYVSTMKYDIKDVAYVVGQTRYQRYVVYYDGSPQEAYLAYTEDGGIKWKLDKSQTVQFEGNKERAGYNFLFLEIRGQEDIRGYGEFRSWQERCISCHTTGFNPDAWAEAKEEFINGEREDLKDIFVATVSISCESCHGPGLEHSTFPLRQETIINPAKLDKEDPTRKLVCEQCHTRTQKNLVYAGSHDNRGFKLGQTAYEEIMQYTRPAWGTGNRQVSIDGKGRRPHQQDMDIRLQDYINGGQTVHGQMACFDCHDSHNVGNNPDNLLTFGETPKSNCITCHGLNSEEKMKVLDGTQGWEKFGYDNWGNEGGRKGNLQHIFNLDEEGRSFGLTPDQYVWALKKDGNPNEKDGWEAIWPWEKDLYRDKGQRVVIGAEPWSQDN